MVYTVKYKRLNGWFWTTLKDIKGDWMDSTVQVPTRVFQTTNEERIEVPIPGVVFKFSKERHMVILGNMEKQAGQKLA